MRIEIGQFICEMEEELTAVIALPQLDNTRSPCFCVGTVRLQADEQEPSEGRILVFSVQRDGAGSSTAATITLVASQQVHGCVYQLVSVEDKNAVAANTSVS